MLADERGYPVELRTPEALSWSRTGSSLNFARFSSRSTWTCGGSGRSLEKKKNR